MSRRLAIQTDLGWPGSKTLYYAHAFWSIAVGTFLMLVPSWCFGPTWSYFSTHGQPLFPAGGFGLGVCCVVIGGLQLVVIAVGKVRTEITLLYLGGFVQWTAGLLFAAEGLLGHQGMIESIYMLTWGGLKIVHSLKLSVDHRRLQNIMP